MLCKRRVNGREDGAGDLVGAVQEPVGEGQHLASGVATQCCEHHGEDSEEEHCVAGDGEGRRIPPGEVEGEGQRNTEREAQRAGIVERHRIAANAPPVPGQRQIEAIFGKLDQQLLATLGRFSRPVRLEELLRGTDRCDHLLLGERVVP